MANIDTIHLPIETRLTITPDSNASGHLVQIHSGSQPTDFTTISASTAIILGPFNNERDYRINLLGGSFTHTMEFVGTDRDDLDLGGFEAAISSPQDGDIPVYDAEAGKFINSEVTGLTENDLAVLTTPVDKQLLIYNALAETFKNGFAAAVDVTYDPIDSGLSATNTKAAIDELKDNADTLEASLSDVATSGDAVDVVYDPASSLMTATDVQAAIDELKATADAYGTMVTEDASDYVLGSEVGTMAAEVAADYTKTADLADVATSGDAGDVAFDNVASGLSGDHVQDAIDEIVELLDGYVENDDPETNVAVITNVATGTQIATAVNGILAILIAKGIMAAP